MLFLKIIDVSDVSLFFVLGCRIAGAILWSKLCKEQTISFLFWEQCPLKRTGALAIQTSNTRPVASLMFARANDKQWAMSGPTRRVSQILLIPPHSQFPFMSSTNIGRRSKTVVKNAHFPAFQPFHRIDLSFSDAD